MARAGPYSKSALSSQPSSCWFNWVPKNNDTSEYVISNQTIIYYNNNHIQVLFSYWFFFVLISII